MELTKEQHPIRRLYPLQEAREKLGGIGHTTIYALIAEGKITTTKIGRRTFVSAEEIDRYIASLESGGRHD
jgi:excisionase family DNA binding protein